MDSEGQPHAQRQLEPPPCLAAAPAISPASTVASSEAAETVPLSIPFYDADTDDEERRGLTTSEATSAACDPLKSRGASAPPLLHQGRTLFIVSLALKVVILSLVGAFVVVCLLRRGLLKMYLEQFIGVIQSLGQAGPPCLALSYGLLIAVFFPVEVLATVAGYIFTQQKSSAYGRIGGLAMAAMCMESAFCISCTLNFFATRSLFAKFRCRLGGAWAEAIDNVIQRRGWRIVALIRLTPVIPFAVSNCLLGFTHVSFTHVLVTVPCTLPLLLFTIYLGSCLPRMGSVTEHSWKWDGLHIAAIIALTTLTLCTLSRIGFLTLQEFKRLTAQQDHHRRNAELEPLTIDDRDSGGNSLVVLHPGSLDPLIPPGGSSSHRDHDN